MHLEADDIIAAARIMRPRSNSRHLSGCMKEIGSDPNADLAPFVQRMSEEHPRLTVRYLQEFTSLGSAGGIYHFRDRILAVMNGDVCVQFPLQEFVAAGIIEAALDSCSFPARRVISSSRTTAGRQ